MDPVVKKSTLDNGVRILTGKMPHVRSVSMGVWVNVGARDESPVENGLSHFIEHMIFKGTERRTAYQIAKEFDAIGGQTNAFTSMENTCYHAKVVDARLPEMMDILSDIFLNSVFDPLEIEKERPVIFQEIGMVEDTPDEFVHMLLGAAYWGSDPLGRSIIGNRENVRSFDSTSIRSFFRRFYQPDRVVISAAGNVDHAEFVDMVASSFRFAGTERQLPERLTPVGRNRIEIKTRDLEQVHICLGTQGLSITDPDRYVFSLMNTIFGGNMSSRLFQEIRECRGLAYSVYSFASSYIDTGMFGVYAGVDSQHAAESVAVILEQMQRMKSSRVDAVELYDAKEFTKGSLLLASESTDNQMSRLAQNEIHWGRYISLTEILDEIESVTEAQICRLAQQLFQTNTCALAIIGPTAERRVFEELIQTL